jgi:hypothetical protein
VLVVPACDTATLQAGAAAGATTSHGSRKLVGLALPDPGSPTVIWSTNDKTPATRWQALRATCFS